MSLARFKPTPTPPTTTCLSLPLSVIVYVFVFLPIRHSFLEHAPILRDHAFVCMQFVIVAAYDFTDPSLPVKERIALGVKRCGMSVTCEMDATVESCRSTKQN